jgi:hypothetical protein
MACKRPGVRVPLAPPTFPQVTPIARDPGSRLARAGARFWERTGRSWPWAAAGRPGERRSPARWSAGTSGPARPARLPRVLEHRGERGAHGRGDVPADPAHAGYLVAHPRLVQRHGRIDRIGSRHTEVFLRCFFPDQRLDDLLGLEERLERKLKQAAAAFGTSEVLPGSAASEITFSESQDEIERLRREDASLFEAGGIPAGAAAGAGKPRDRRAHPRPAVGIGQRPRARRIQPRLGVLRPPVLPSTVCSSRS